MTLTIANSLDEKLWRDFVDQHPQGNIFHTPEMFKVFARSKGHIPILWTTIDDWHHPLALLLPVQITINNGLFQNWTSRAVAYGSVLSTPGAEGREALKLLLQSYQCIVKGRILFTELRNQSDLSNLQPILNECNFSYEDHMNYLIDLDQSEETLWNYINKSGRKNVRLSVNKGTVVEEVTDRRKLMLAYHLLQNVYSRVRVPLTDISLFEAAYDILAPLGMFKVFIARVEDHYIGTSLILMYKGKIIAWYGGSDKAFSSCHCGELLKWHVLKWGKEHGYHEFDFGGAGKPSEEYGPRNFKAKFGGTLINYGRNVCIHKPIAYKVSKTAYALMRKF